MKLTKEVLKQIIKEEIQAVLNEEKQLSDEGKKTHAENLRMAKTEMKAKELAAKMKLPSDFETINKYRTYVGRTYVGPSSEKLARAINIRMRGPAAKKIAGTRM